MTLRNILFALLAALMLPGAAMGHEAHRQDMSDEEMAEAASETAPVNSTGDAGKHTVSQPGPLTDDHPASMTDLLGRLHPALVHFPIALFLAAGLAELLAVLRPALGLEATTRFLVYTGAAGGLIAAALGWFAGGWRLSDRSETLGLHRWTGTGIALAGLVLALVVARSGHPAPRRLLLAGLAIALVVQGYWGGELSLGPNHLGL